MALDEQLRQLADQVPPPPAGDAAAVFQHGRRRRRARRAVGVSAVAAVVAVLGVGVVSALGGQPLIPEVADRPDQNEADVSHPDGWLVVRAGELEVSVPPDWEVTTVEPGPGPLLLAGPCLYDLYGGIEDLGSELTAPSVVVYPVETTGSCRAIGLPDHPPAYPSLVLYAGVTSEWGGNVPRDEGEVERIGEVAMARLVSDSHEHLVQFRRPDGGAGLLVSNLDDPLVQRVLATLRLADAPDADAGDAQDDGAESGVCAAPQVRPTYLPWLEDGDPVPAPTYVHEGTDDAPDGWVVWAEDPAAFDPEGYSDTSHVTIASIADPAAIDRTDHPDLEVRGTPAALIWIGFNNVSITWGGTAPCATFTMWLTLAPVDGIVEWLDLDRSTDVEDEGEAAAAATEAELLRIADSITGGEEAATPQALYGDRLQRQDVGAFTGEQRDLLDLRASDELFWLPIEGTAARSVGIRERDSSAPLMFATDCGLLDQVELPDGWVGLCLEYTDAEQGRVRGLFPHGTTLDE